MKKLIIAFILLIPLLLSSCMETIQTISPTAEPSETAKETITETSVLETTHQKLPTIEDVNSVLSNGETLTDVCKVLGEYEDYICGYSYAYFFWTLDNGKNLTLWFDYNGDKANVDKWTLRRTTGISPLSDTVIYDKAYELDNAENVTLDQLEKELGDPLYYSLMEGLYVWKVDNGQYLKYCQANIYIGISEDVYYECLVQIVDFVPYDKTLEVKPGMTFQEAVDILGFTGMCTGSCINFNTNYGWELDNGQIFNICFGSTVKADAVISDVSYIGIPKE